MDTSFVSILIWSLWLFAIIFFSVRLAIKPLLKKPEEEIKEGKLKVPQGREYLELILLISAPGTMLNSL